MIDIFQSDDKARESITSLATQTTALLLVLIDKGVMTEEEYKIGLEAADKLVKDKIEELKKEAEEKFKAEHPTLANLFSR